MGKNLNFLQILLLTVVVAGIPSAKLGIFSLSRGLAPEKCLSSDAESWVYQASQLQILKTPISDYSYLNIFLNLLVKATQVTGFSIFSTSILMSWACSIVFGFLCFKIAEVFLAFEYSVLFSALCLLETHVLGGTTFGCSPFGIMPRELALCIAIYILYIKLSFSVNSAATIKNTLIITYGATGILFYIYPPQALGLFLLILGFDLINVRGSKNLKQLIIALLTFGLIATPFAVSYLMATKAGTPVDQNILKQRNSFMLLTGFDTNTYLYLRRFLYQTTILIAAAVFIAKVYPRWFRDRAKSYLIPFIIVSLLLSVLGLYLEKNTGLITLFISRSSIFYALFFYLFCLLMLQKYNQETQIKLKVPIIFLVVISLMINTNIFGFIRQCRSEFILQPKTLEFFSIIDKHAYKVEKGSLFLVSYSPERDYAAMFRSYTGLGVFVCDKEGGISLVDGDLAKNWANRTRVQNQILSLVSLEEVKKVAKQLRVTSLILATEDVSVNVQLNKELKRIAAGRSFVEILVN